ncbi:MAG TPA: DinB family protein [Candidatus Dormibacteraeota bacterium]
MDARGLKQRLRVTVAAAREREHELVILCDDSPPVEPGMWTVKDHLAHVAAWRFYAAAVLDAVRTGTTPPHVEDNDDDENAKIYVANKDKSADEVKSDARKSFDVLEAAIEACSDGDLTKPHPRAPKAALWQIVPGNGHAHLGQHLMFWHLEQGNEEGAEAAQQWVYDIDRAEFPDPKSMAASSYNFGCFYSRVGRADEALRRLKHAFELDPSLKDIALTDPDLDRMRNDPELVALIGS